MRHNPRDGHVAVLFLFVIIIGALVATCVPRATRAQDHHPNHGWYEKLMSPQGFSCCNDRDCRPVKSRISEDGKGYEVCLGSKDSWDMRCSWVAVPPDRVLPGWMNKQPLSSHICEQDGYVRCFLPGDAGG